MAQTEAGANGRFATKLPGGSNAISKMKLEGISDGTATTDDLLNAI